MTKDELKKEAEEKADEYTNLRPFHIGYEEGYYDGAEPREKQIQEKDRKIAELEKENAELKNKLENIRYYLDNEIPHELINEATTIIYKMV